MKQLKTIIIVSLALVFLTFGSAMAGDHPMGHGKSMEHPTGDHPTGHEEHPTKHDMDHSSHKGDNIRNATVDGYSLAYHLIDMREKMKEMKAAGHQHKMDMTHHLMIYVKSPEGNAIHSAKVGYLVVGPNEEKQKLMCMAMAGGFGADINFSAPGAYAVKAKVVSGEKKFMDTFSYTVK